MRIAAHDGQLSRSEEIPIQFARLQQKQIGRRVGNRSNRERRDRGPAAPVARIGDIAQPFAASPRQKAVRTVADAGFRIESGSRQRGLRSQDVRRQNELW